MTSAEIVTEAGCSVLAGVVLGIVFEVVIDLGFGVQAEVLLEAGLEVGPGVRALILFEVESGLWAGILVGVEVGSGV